MSKVTNQQDEVAALIAIYTADVTDALDAATQRAAYSICPSRRWISRSP